METSHCNQHYADSQLRQGASWDKAREQWCLVLGVGGRFGSGSCSAQGRPPRGQGGGDIQAEF